MAGAPPARIYMHHPGLSTSPGLLQKRQLAVVDISCVHEAVDIQDFARRPKPPLE
jgi:hypothetical protein